MITLDVIANCCDALSNLPAPIVKEGANDCNVLIATIICISLVLVALIAAITISQWHKKEIAKSLGETQKNKDHGLSQQEQQEKDKREYISKLISFREELAKKDSKLKDIDDRACQEYIDLLSKLANI